jgi:hypothetical protein
VQGYKFNIFYPDLIDKGLTPQFTLIPTDNGDFCILKITSGKILTIRPCFRNKEFPVICTRGCIGSS